MGWVEIGIGFGISVVSGFIGAFILWLIQQRYLNKQAGSKEELSKRIVSPNRERVIGSDIFTEVGSGRDVALMRAMLGVPNKTSKTDDALFIKKSVKTNSFLYFFKNANVKITSRDGMVIDSLTVLCHDKSLSLDYFLMDFEDDSLRLGELRVSKEFVEYELRHDYLQARLDSSFALQLTTAAPHYLTFTYFGFGGDGIAEYYKTKNPAAFIGETIDGICISEDKNLSFYIYDYELR